MENKINSQVELYNRVKPALRTKRHELLRNNIKIVKEMDIWNFNVEHNWKDAKGLTIALMVDHILNTSDEIYEQYVLDKINARI